MEYTILEGTGLKVSRLCLGCLGFGDPDWREWVVDREAAMPVLERAIDLGINFFDTANMYSRGESERILGEALNGYRERSVVASKVYFPMDEDDPNAEGLSRKAIDRELAGTLDRLGLDTIDLYQVHRWDYDAPIEETMRTLDDAVRRGDVRYLGASSMWAYQFQSALATSRHLGLERFVTMQNHYNLVYREDERELLPLCDCEDIAVLPWSPLARGFLTRSFKKADATTRGQTVNDMFDHPYHDGNAREINERVQQLAADKGVSMAQLALAWLLHKDVVSVPVIGTTSVEHLEEAVEALELSLSDSDLEYLEEPYVPIEVWGHE